MMFLSIPIVFHNRPDEAYTNKPNEAVSFIYRILRDSCRKIRAVVRKFRKAPDQVRRLTGFGRQNL
jgi:hypothetical protein